MLQTWAPWAIFTIFSALTWYITPRQVDASQFFSGRRQQSNPPGVFAKSIANSTALAETHGLAGGIGYTLYYLSFPVAGVAIWAIRRRWHYRSLTHLLVEGYGPACARLFLLLVTFRLLNEVWFNTKVISLYFGAEGSAPYWVAPVLVTGFTVAYAWRGGMQASLTTDRIHILLAFLLLAVVLAFIMPSLSRHRRKVACRWSQRLSPLDQFESVSSHLASQDRRPPHCALGADLEEMDGK